MSSGRTEKSGENVSPAPADGQLHKPPSVLWFVIPLGLLMLYALFTR